MKFTALLMAYKQRNHRHNMLRWKRYQWFQQSQLELKKHPTMRSNLQERGIPIYEATSVVKEDIYKNYPREAVDPIVGFKYPAKFIPKHNKPCLMYGDDNVLVEGLSQAKILTNTVEIETGLPESVESSVGRIKVDKQDELVQFSIASALIYDAYQEKLPPRTLPGRIMHKLPRDYGITDLRRNANICDKLLQLCELVAGPEKAARMWAFPNAMFSVHLPYKPKILLQQKADILLTSDVPLKPLADPKCTRGIPLPDMEPMHPTISLKEEYTYNLKDIYPFKYETNLNLKHAHTAILHFNVSETKNLYGTPVTDSQFIGRSLMKAYTMALSKARFLYGADVKGELPEPIVVQCLQTDSQKFHFSIFQLNTTDAWFAKVNEESSDSNDGGDGDGDGRIRNIFWSDDILFLYEFCGYNSAKPSIVSYNAEVFKKFVSFYAND